MRSYLVLIFVMVSIGFLAECPLRWIVVPCSEIIGDIQNIDRQFTFMQLAVSRNLCIGASPETVSFVFGKPSEVDKSLYLHGFPEQLGKADAKWFYYRHWYSVAVAFKEGACSDIYVYDAEKDFNWQENTVDKIIKFAEGKTIEEIELFCGRPKTYGIKPFSKTPGSKSIDRVIYYYVGASIHAQLSFRGNECVDASRCYILH